MCCSENVRCDQELHLSHNLFTADGVKCLVAAGEAWMKHLVPEMEESPQLMTVLMGRLYFQG